MSSHYGLLIVCQCVRGVCRKIRLAKKFSAAAIDYIHTLKVKKEKLNKIN
jgi:hypothetical protein